MRDLRVVVARAAHCFVVATFMAAVGAATPIARAAAQAAVAPGDWVRALPAGREWRVAGRVIAADSAGFTLLPESPHRRPIALRYADLRTLDVRLSRESAGQGAVRGVGVGLAAGFVAGSLFTTGVFLSHADENCDDCFISPTALAAVFGGALTLGAGVVGAGIGAYNPRQQWRRVLPPPRVSLTPIVPSGANGGGAGLALSLRF